ncbi:PREDICTED: protein unc-45 homolog B-like [Acropora digitifera]|uniref:protein unc-45 homolog B-like n=1 Tax=Acropora digitifera TaxID=70779 RepID=UPI00077B247F|nr:PREDICTED: protein unc-45 homolog B-like [Acropora digitifera]
MCRRLKLFRYVSEEVFSSRRLFPKPGFYLKVWPHHGNRYIEKDMEKQDQGKKTASDLKAEGNEHFQAAKYDMAAVCYTQALKLCYASENDKERIKEKGVILKNRAACYLKLEKYEEAVSDATEALNILPNDPKALFRRCQAEEKLGKLEAAFQDARTVLHTEPKNTAVQEALKRLGSQLQAKTERCRTTDGLVDEMLNALFNKEDNNERRAQVQDGELPRVISLLNNGSNEETVSMLKVLKGLCTNSKLRSLSVLSGVTLPRLLALIESPDKDVATATILVPQQALDSLIPKPPDRKDNKNQEPPKELENEKEVEGLITLLLDAVISEKVGSDARDAIVDVFIKVIPKNKLAVELFVKVGGVRKLMFVAAATASVESQDGEPLSVTNTTRMHISVALAKMVDSFGYHQKEKEPLMEDAQAGVSQYLFQSSPQAHIKGATALCCLFQGVQEAASSLLGKEEFLGKIVALAKNTDRLSQVVASETLALAASEKNLSTVLNTHALPVLKDLYHLKDDSIRVRALVGLCKLGSTGGGTVNDQTFAEGATLKLYKSVRSFLTKSKKDMEVRKWAAEGLSFVTMDAEVKEIFLEDLEALKALLELTKAKDGSLLYGVCQTLVNLTNTFDKPDIPDEMKQLGEFAKVKLPKFHEKDGEEYVRKRIRKLVEEGVISALVNLANTESGNSREMIARVFMGIVSEQEHRGMAVQHGAVKALVALSVQNTEKGADLACQALAKVAITMNPEVAFPGQRSFGLIRPLLKLLHPSKTVSQRLINFSPPCSGPIELNHAVFKMYEKEDAPTERVKLLTLLSGEEDFELSRAASGALAILSSSEKVCKQIIKVSSYMEIQKQLLVSDNKELRHRGAHIAANMIASNKDIATKIIESEVLEILMVFSNDEDPEMSMVRACAERALEIAEGLSLIKQNKESS